jgi:hypothetical protein
MDVSTGFSGGDGGGGVDAGTPSYADQIAAGTAEGPPSPSYADQIAAGTAEGPPAPDLTLPDANPTPSPLTTGTTDAEAAAQSQTLSQQFAGLKSQPSYLTDSTAQAVLSNERTAAGATDTTGPDGSPVTRLSDVNKEISGLSDSKFNELDSAMSQPGAAGTGGAGGGSVDYTKLATAGLQTGGSIASAVIYRNRPPSPLPQRQSYVAPPLPAQGPPRAPAYYPNQSRAPARPEGGGQGGPPLQGAQGLPPGAMPMTSQGQPRPQTQVQPKRQPTPFRPTTPAAGTVAAPPKSPSNTGAIIGVVGGGVLLLCAAGAAIWAGGK